LADSLGGGYVTVNFTDQNGCTGFDSVNVVQLPAMVSTIASISSVSCNGAVDGSVTVTPVTGGAPPYDYNWSNGDSGLTADSLPGGIATLTITDVNNCTVQVVATINEPAQLTASTTTQPISCDGQSDGVAVVSVSGGTLPYSYAWSPVGGNSATASGLDEGSYSVTVTDFNNCMTADSATIGTGDCDLELPTGFTPNGDGKNDFYVIHGLSRYPDNALKVFNRWGNEVLSVENYSNTEWYGQNNDGENLPDGTYFVVFKVTGQDVTRNSYVELKR
jgi:gliding motility-associated-like protein